MGEDGISSSSVDQTDQMVTTNDRFTDNRACVANVSDGHQVIIC
jgi:hypothetical protein